MGKPKIPCRVWVPRTRFYRLFELTNTRHSHPLALHSAKEPTLTHIHHPLFSLGLQLSSNSLFSFGCCLLQCSSEQEPSFFFFPFKRFRSSGGGAPIMEKLGIVTILCSDCEKSKAAPLRRTLSADMSSKKWLAQNGFFSPIEKISLPSDLELGNQLDSEEECRKEKDDRRVGKTSALDVSSSILSKKREDSTKISEPYIHPLVKRSASSLSEKSLEICTESLGSETGSGCFSSYLASEISDADEEKEDHEYEQKQQQQQVKESNSFEDFYVVKYKNSPPRPFPPPIPSIADGNSIQIQSHRRNGRLVLEAVSVPPRNNFHVQRCNGRLVLTLIRSPISPEPRSEIVEEDNVQEFDGVFDDMEEIDQDVEEKINGGYEEEEAAEEADEERVKQNNAAQVVEFVMDQNSRSLPIGGTIKKLMRVANKNPKWSNKIVNLKEVKELPIPQSLPPRHARVPRLIPPPPHPATSFNSYQYFWRSKSNPRSTPFKNNACLANGAKTYDQQNTVLVKGTINDEYFLPLSMSCKKPRRSMLTWEHNCVATS